MRMVELQTAGHIGAAALISSALGAAIAALGAPLLGAPAPIIALAMASSLASGLTAAWWAHAGAARTLSRQRSRMQSIIETVADGIAVTDGHGRIESFNAAAERMFGYSRAQILGKPLSLLLDGDAAAAANVEALLVHAPRPAVGLGREVVGRRRDGTTFALEIAVTEMSAGDERRFTAVFRDVTVRKHVHRALAEARDAALASTQARSAFLANVSHEIRTPINIILGMTEMIADAGDLNEDQRDFLDRTRSATRTLLSLLDDTLDLSKIEAGMMTISPEEMDLREIVTDVAELLTPRAEQKGVELVSDLAPDLPAKVRGDPARIRQILTNFGGNAVKFTERGRIAIEARPVEETATHTTIRLAVRDSGIGIPRERQEAIFESYQQADASSARSFGGTGLGLAICKQLAKLMGGAIGVVSEPGEGSEFWVEIPFERVASEGAAAPGAPAAGESPARA